MHPTFRWLISVVLAMALFVVAHDQPQSSGRLVAADKEKAKPLNLELFGRNLRAVFGGPANVPEVEVQQTEQQINEEQIQAFALQFEQQYRPIMCAELEFIRLVCDDLDLEQRKAVRQAAEDAVKKTARAGALQQNAQQGVVIMNGVAVNANPRDSIRMEVKKSSKSAMSKDQFDRYEQAMTERLETKRRAAIDGAVAMTDHHLFLTSKQRDEIQHSLEAGWQDGWEKWLVMVTTFGDQFFPEVPENLITPFLTEEQKHVWKSIRRQNFEFWGGGQAVEFNEDGWWGPDPKPEDGIAPAVRIRQALEIFR